MILVILIVAVVVPLLYAVIEIDHRMNKNDPEVKW
jgi:hypothetical protein